MSRPSKPQSCLSAFGEKAARPTEKQLHEVLGVAAPAWDALIAQVERAHAPVVRQWNYSGSKYGWSLRLKRRDRNVVYLTPQAGWFLVGLVLGPRAVATVEQGTLPAAVRKALREAPKYAEGTGLRLRVVDEKVLPAIAKLLAAKMA